MSKGRERNATLLLMFFLLAMCCGICFEALYALPDGDDFGYFYLMKRGIQEGKSFLRSALDVVSLYYNKWSGDFVSLFLINFISPFYRFGLLGHSLFCFLGACTLFVAIFFFFKIMINSTIQVSSAIWGTFIALLVVAGWLDTFTPKEILYWYTCVYSYCVGLISKLIISSILISTYKKNKKRNTVVLSLLLFGLCILSSAVGTQNLCISIGMFLFFALLGVLDEKWKIISFGSGTVLSAIIVLSAPGNYVRANSGHGTTDSITIRLITAAFDSTKSIARMGLKKILRSPFFWIVLCIIIFLRLASIVLSRNELNSKQILKRVVASCVLMYSSVFPVCYGYQLSFLSPRTECVAGFILWGLAFYWMVYLSQLIPSLRIDSKKRAIMLHSIVTGAVLLSPFFYFIGGNAGILAYRELASGKPQLQWKNWEQIYSEVEASNENKVTVNINNEYITGLMTRHDEVEWDGVNVISRSYMAYCGKDEVVVNWHTDDGVYTLYGYKGPLAIDYK